jgi:hypothetical protein
MKAKRLRKYVKDAMRADNDAAWRSMLLCPFRARLVLACRLVSGRQMDGTTTEKERSK